MMESSKTPKFTLDSLSAELITLLQNVIRTSKCLKFDKFFEKFMKQETPTKHNTEVHDLLNRVENTSKTVRYLQQLSNNLLIDIRAQKQKLQNLKENSSENFKNTPP